MDSPRVLTDALNRVQSAVHNAVRDLTSDELAWRPDPDANSIGWITWHLARIQDAQIAPLARRAEVWHDGDWLTRFEVPFGPDATGFGQTAHEVAQLRTTEQLLVGYYDAVHAQTMRFFSTVTPNELDQVVDEAWDPPVTLGVRLVSIIADDLQHAGQANYVRGLVDRLVATPVSEI